MFLSFTSAESSFPGHSHRLLSAFSFECLIGFTLLSDTCWKCNCARNCYVVMEAALLPYAGAFLRKRNNAPVKPFLYPHRWSSLWAFFLDAGHLAQRMGKARRKYLLKHADFHLALGSGKLQGLLMILRGEDGKTQQKFDNHYN